MFLAMNLSVGFTDVKDNQKELEILGFGGDSIHENDEIFAPFEADVPAISQVNLHVHHSVETIA